MENETIKINDTEFRVIRHNEPTKNSPWYKCECSAIIKKESNLEKHTLTKSHQQNLINKFYFAPPKVSLLRPDIKFHS